VFGAEVLVGGAATFVGVLIGFLLAFLTVQAAHRHRRRRGIPATRLTQRILILSKYLIG
jgi:hypothetical protein